MTQKRLSKLSVQISDLQEIFETRQHMLYECKQGGHDISCHIIQILGR